MDDALSIDDARDRILADTDPLPPIDLPLLEVHGCVLGRDVVAETDVPAFAASESDGFAVRAADLHGAGIETPVRLRLVGWSRFGAPPARAVGWGEVTGIEAGAALPSGADSVVTTGVLEGDYVGVIEPVEPGALVREAGEVARAGEVLVRGGRRLGPAEAAMLAAAGLPAVPVHAQVRVAVLVAGDLAEPGRPATFGQAPDAVSFAMVGAVRDAGAIPYRIGIVRGQEEEIREALVSNLARADAFVCAGEVFAGSGHDLVTSGLGSIEPMRVAMSPGGDLDVGRIEGKPYFGLPLDPVAALISFELLVRPALLRLMARDDHGRPEVRAKLEDPLLDVAKGVTLAPVRVDRGADGWRARTLEGSPLAAFVRANGLASMSPEAGEISVRLLRPPVG